MAIRSARDGCRSAVERQFPPRAAGTPSILDSQTDHKIGHRTCSLFTRHSPDSGDFGARIAPLNGFSNGTPAGAASLSRRFEVGYHSQNRRLGYARVRHQLAKVPRSAAVRRSTERTQEVRVEVLRGWRPKLPANPGSGVYLQPARRDLSARGSALRAPPGEPSSPDDRAEQRRRRHGDIDGIASLFLSCSDRRGSCRSRNAVAPGANRAELTGAAASVRPRLIEVRGSSMANVRCCGVAVIRLHRPAPR